MSNENKKHRLVRHMLGESNPPSNEPCLDNETFNQFIQYAQARRAAGLTVPSIREVLAPRPERTNP